jgi:predicted permease
MELGTKIIIFAVISGIAICLLCVVLLSFAKRILKLELMMLEMAKVVFSTHYITQSNSEHIGGLAEAIFQRDKIEESMNQTLN